MEKDLSVPEIAKRFRDEGIKKEKEGRKLLEEGQQLLKAWEALSKGSVKPVKRRHGNRKEVVVSALKSGPMTRKEIMSKVPNLRYGTLGNVLQDRKTFTKQPGQKWGLVEAK